MAIRSGRRAGNQSGGLRPSHMFTGSIPDLRLVHIIRPGAPPQLSQYPRQCQQLQQLHPRLHPVIIRQTEHDFGLFAGYVKSAGPTSHTLTIRRNCASWDRAAAPVGVDAGKFSLNVYLLIFMSAYSLPNSEIPGRIYAMAHNPWLLLLFMKYRG